jgi:hypothetical protein
MRKVIARHRYVAAVAGLLLVIILSFSFISFNLFLTARTAQRNAENLAIQWSKKAGELQEDQRTAKNKLVPMHFTSVLEMLRQGHIAQADKAGLYFDEDSKERIATEFLISPQPLKDKEAKFRRILGEKQAWFADFVVGEHYLKDKNYEQALNAYRSSFKTLQKDRPEEVWLIKLVEARIYELTELELKERELSTARP